jgi:alcohol dehydrogenase
MDRVIARELVIMGSHGLQAHAFPPLLDMIEQGKLRPKRLVRKTVSLEEGVGELMSMNEFRRPGMIVIDRFS